MRRRLINGFAYIFIISCIRQIAIASCPYFNNINLSIMRCDADKIENRIKEQIEYDILAERYNPDALNEIVLLMSDVFSGCSETVHIGGSDYPREVVCSRFFKLSCEHISYVLDRMEKNTSDVRNIRAYLLTLLYNAPATMDHYYQSAAITTFAGEPKPSFFGS